MNLKFLCSILLIGFFSATAHGKTKASTESASPVARLAGYKNLGSLVRVLQTRLSVADSRYLLDELRRHKIPLSGKLGLNQVGKDSFQVKGIKGVFQVRLNGREISYAGKTFRWNKSWSFKRNVDAINSVMLAQQHSWLFPRAHAAENIETDRRSGLLIGGALSYLSMVDRESKSVEELAKDRNVTSLLGYDSVQQIRDVTCEYDSEEDKKSRMPKIRITHRNGRSVLLARGQGSEDLYSFVEGGDLPAMNISSGQDSRWDIGTYRDLVGSYCAMSRPLQLETLAKLNKLVDAIPRDSAVNAPGGTQVEQ